jgi:predicted ribosome quality control (RQC) complex YloA/Tae2 family protein
LKNAGDVEIVKALARQLGLGGIYAEELLLRAKMDKTKPSSEVSDAEAKAVFEALQSLLSPILSGRLEPCIVLDEKGNFADVVPFKLNRHANAPLQPCPNFNNALDEFYVKTTAAEKATAEIETAELRREAEKLKRVVAEQQRVAAEAEEKARREMQIGNVIYAHTAELHALLDVFAGAKNEGRDWNSVVSRVAAAKSSGTLPFTFYESFDSRNLAVNVNADSLKFSLSLRKTLFENAAEYYEQGKKARQKSAGALAALEESRRRLAEVEAAMAEAERLKSVKPAEAMEEISRRRVASKEWFQKFRWFTSSEGFLVVAGKDSVSNEVLIKKHTEPDDVVFHADIVGSPFVVVKTGGKEPGEQTLREAAEFAAAFSRAWRENMGSADVYWVKPEQLAKSGPSGEYVPHGAFAVSGKRNWMRGVPLRVAVGVVVNEDVQFVGGPVDTVKAKTKTFAVMRPGDHAGKELLKQVLRVLALKLPKEQREKMGKVSIESIRELVPYTKGRIAENA